MILSIQNIRKHLEQKGTPIWDVIAKIDKYGEDNDSSEVESDEEDEVGDGISEITKEIDGFTIK